MFLEGLALAVGVLVTPYGTHTAAFVASCWTEKEMAQ
jgi:hypothetical protein